MIIAILIINVLAMLSCGMAAGMNINSGNTFLGASMMLLFIVNMMCFITNLGRL